MNIQKLTFENKELVKKCDKLFLKFLESEKNMMKIIKILKKQIVL